MKKLLAVFYILIANVANAYAVVTVPASMKQAMKGDSDMPSILNLVLSMVIVIGLIYVTGWIYQKLNKINRKKLLNHDLIEKNSFNVISSLPLGQQKNLYAVEINNKILVLGATAQNISMLKEFDKDENLEIDLNTISDKKDSIDEKAQGLEVIYKKYKD